MSTLTLENLKVTTSKEQLFANLATKEGNKSINDNSDPGGIKNIYINISTSMSLCPYDSLLQVIKNKKISKTNTYNDSGVCAFVSDVVIYACLNHWSNQ